MSADDSPPERARASWSPRCSAISTICRFASAAAARDGRAHRRRRRRAGADRGVGAARRVAERDRHVLERDAELFGGDLRHRRLRPRADVLHRRDDGRVAVGADADPRVARRAAAAVPDLRRHPDAALDGVGRARAHLVAALPVRLGAAVALEQLLARCTAARRLRPGRRSCFRRSSSGSRSSFEASSSSSALEPERPLDEARARGTPSSAAG